MSARNCGGTSRRPRSASFVSKLAYASSAGWYSPSRARRPSKPGVPSIGADCDPQSTSVALEVLHGAFVLFRRGEGLERAEISTFPRLRIFLPRVQAILTRCELANHPILLHRSHGATQTGAMLTVGLTREATMTVTDADSATLVSPLVPDVYASGKP